jgi:hypothetical protein
MFKISYMYNMQLGRAILLYPVEKIRAWHVTPQKLCLWPS